MKIRRVAAVWGHSPIPVVAYANSITTPDIILEVPPSAPNIKSSRLRVLYLKGYPVPEIRKLSKPAFLDYLLNFNAPNNTPIQSRIADDILQLP